MKNKRTVYLLVAIVGSVWGVIFFKIYGGLPGKDDFSVPEIRRKDSSYFNLIDHQNDTATVTGVLNDPFKSLNASEQVEVIESGYSGATAIAVAPFKAPVNWSGILYKGYIRNNKSKQNVAILMVNGKEAMLSEGESFGGIKLIKHNEDSVKIAYQNSEKYILIR